MASLGIVENRKCLRIAFSWCMELHQCVAEHIQYLLVGFACISYGRFSGFGGLVVSMLASGTQDHGFAPG
jgi:hypothetical protein